MGRLGSDYPHPAIVDPGPVAAPSVRTQVAALAMAQICIPTAGQWHLQVPSARCTLSSLRLRLLAVPPRPAAYWLRLSHCTHMLLAPPFSPTQVHAEQAPVIKKVGLKLVKKRKTPPEELARQVADQVLRSSMLRCARSRSKGNEVGSGGEGLNMGGVCGMCKYLAPDPGVFGQQTAHAAHA